MYDPAAASNGGVDKDAGGGQVRGRHLLGLPEGFRLSSPPTPVTQT